MDKGGALHEGQAGFRVNRSCMDNAYTLNEIVQGRFSYPTATEEPAEIEETARTGTIGGGDTRSGRD